MAAILTQSLLDSPTVPGVKAEWITAQAPAQDVSLSNNLLR